jgi:hypothetical protein
MPLPLTTAVSSCVAAASLVALFLRVGNTPRDETIVPSIYFCYYGCNITRQRQYDCESVAVNAAATKPPTFCEWSGKLTARNARRKNISSVRWAS